MQEEKRKNEDMQDKIILTSYTDPACTWCWGEEPVFRKLETHYPGKILFRYTMGGMIEDYREFSDSEKEPSTEKSAAHAAETFNQQVGAHRLEASRMHHMPEEGAHFALYDEAHPGTYPLCIAYKAAQRVSPERAGRFLYELRYAIAAEARLANRREVQISIAARAGVDVARFVAALDDGSAERAFQGDLLLTQLAGVTSFPSMEVKINTARTLLRGFQPYETFVDVILEMTYGAVLPTIPQANEEALFALLSVHPHMAYEEVRAAFDFETLADVDAFLLPFIEAGKIEQELAAGSAFVRTRVPTLSCGPSGVCR